MIDTSGEVDFGRLEWIVRGEMYCEEKYTAGVWTVTLSPELVREPSYYSSW